MRRWAVVCAVQFQPPPQTPFVYVAAHCWTKRGAQREYARLCQCQASPALHYFVQGPRGR